MPGLGSSEGSVLGETFLTNGNDGERVPNLQIIARLSGELFDYLDRSPQIRRWLVKALDQGIPLNLDYHAWAAVREVDHDFRLSEPKHGVRLGFTTALGRTPEMRKTAKPAASDPAPGKNLKSARGRSV